MPRYSLNNTFEKYGFQFNLLGIQSSKLLQNPQYYEKCQIGSSDVLKTVGSFEQGLILTRSEMMCKVLLKYYHYRYLYKRRTYKRRTVQTSDLQTSDRTNVGQEKGRTVQTSDWYKRQTGTNIGLVQTSDRKNIRLQQYSKIINSNLENPQVFS